MKFTLTLDFKLYSVFKQPGPGLYLLLENSLHLNTCQYEKAVMITWMGLWTTVLVVGVALLSLPGDTQLCVALLTTGTSSSWSLPSNEFSRGWKTGCDPSASFKVSWTAVYKTSDALFQLLSIINWHFPTGNGWQTFTAWEVQLGQLLHNSSQTTHTQVYIYTQHSHICLGQT